ncbi:hypothetical protein [Microcoleus sp. bin38.metabat.b11b12b14.051]|uniref:hypothetical protein n=1 Tax=Microcoleus sp. bin38.metabat.b11b12b14.051 TaxID=2742709 RepID=UPI0025FAED2C|nr:hypothetical protein [Microcoleus sp. bin38.metabat.b11b12b14.051]
MIFASNCSKLIAGRFSGVVQRGVRWRSHFWEVGRSISLIAPLSSPHLLKPDRLLLLSLHLQRSGYLSLQPKRQET